MAQQSDTTHMADPGSMAEVESKREKDLEDYMRAKMEEEELILNETVEQMMNMEINQRKNEGGMECFEEGSKYRLEFNNWKTERE